MSTNPSASPAQPDNKSVVATFGPRIRCGRLARHLEVHPCAWLVVHRDGFPPCPVRPGDRPEPQATGSSDPGPGVRAASHAEATARTA